MKQCTKCKVTKPLVDFYNNRNRVDGKAPSCKACQKSAAAKRREEINAYHREYSKKPERSKYLREWQAGYRQTEQHREWRKDYLRSEKGRAVVNMHTAKRRAALHDALVPGKEVPRMDWVVEYYGKPCLFPGCDKEISKKNPVTFDHIVPISKGGKHTYENCQPLCKSHNSQKHTSFADYRQGNVMTDNVVVQLNRDN